MTDFYIEKPKKYESQFIVVNLSNIIFVKSKIPKSITGLHFTADSIKKRFSKGLSREICKMTICGIRLKNMKDTFCGFGFQNCQKKYNIYDSTRLLWSFVYTKRGALMRNNYYCVIFWEFCTSSTIWKCSSSGWRSKI